MDAATEKLDVKEAATEKLDVKEAATEKLDVKDAGAFFPYLRSCKKESSEPLTGTLKGEIPKWLKGSLIRVGSGLLEVGPDKYNHLFDGLALLHAFQFEDGSVTYRNRFLRSDTYRANMKANRIVISEFATRGAPDPCKTIFQRFSSLFSMSDFTDNDLVTIVRYSDEFYACSELNYIWRIDPNDLQAIKKVNLSEAVAVNFATAHAHEDRDGTVYNVGSSYGSHGTYNIIKFEPKKESTDDAFARGSVVCKIPFLKSKQPCYFHSFAMTDNYFVFVEQPLHLSLLRMAWAKYVSGTIADSMRWEANELTHFHVVRRSDGQLLSTKFVAKAFFLFHHINAYEDEGHLVMDLCGFEDWRVIQSLYVKAMEDMYLKKSPNHAIVTSRARRYVLPIGDDLQNAKPEENLVKLTESKAKATIQTDGTIFCEPDILTGDEPWSPELPRINYEVHNGRKYKYFYAIARSGTLERTHLIKVNAENRSTVSWNESGSIPSEPVFVADPNSKEKDEDSGVLVASLLYTSDDKKVSLLVLDAKSMKEIGRVDFQTEAVVPGDFHGTFVQNV